MNNWMTEELQICVDRMNFLIGKFYLKKLLKWTLNFTSLQTRVIASYHSKFWLSMLLVNPMV